MISGPLSEKLTPLLGKKLSELNDSEIISMLNEEYLTQELMRTCFKDKRLARLVLEDPILKRTIPNHAQQRTGFFRSVSNGCNKAFMVFKAEGNKYPIPVGLDVLYSIALHILAALLFVSKMPKLLGSMYIEYVAGSNMKTLADFSVANENANNRNNQNRR